MFLHDRALAGSRTGIDLIALAPSGVWVVAARHEIAGKVRVARSPRRPPRLRIGGHDATGLITRLLYQVEAVEGVLGRLGHRLRPRGVLCFLDGGLPLVRAQSIEGIPLLYPGRLVERLNHEGPLQRELAELLAAQLAERLPPA
jgi:hypothetical protein